MLLRLAAWLEERPEGPLPVMMSGGGPPAHWVERVRKAAPQLISSNVIPDVPTTPPPPRDVPRVGVPRGSDVQTARAALQLSSVEPASQQRERTTDTTATSHRPVAGVPQRATPVPLRPTGGEKVPEGRMTGMPSNAIPTAPHPALRATLGSQAGRGAKHIANNAATSDGRSNPTPPTNRWPELVWTAATQVAALTPGAENRAQAATGSTALPTWPELPEPHESRIESLHDDEHLRRIAHEQRGDAWSE